MGAYLDIDDAAAGNPVAENQLARLRATIAEQAGEIERMIEMMREESKRHHHEAFCIWCYHHQGDKHCHCDMCEYLKDKDGESAAAGGEGE